MGAARMSQAAPRIAEERATRPAAEVVAIRESSIVTLAAHGVLDAAQVSAAMRFRDHWERYASLHRSGQIIERVDHGRRPPGTGREDAARELKRIRQIVGQHAFELLIRVCGEGHHVRDLYQARRDRDTATDILRINLTLLARAHDLG